MKVDSFLIFGSDKKMIACRDRLRERDFRADVFDRKSSIENIKCYNYKTFREGEINERYFIKSR